MNTRQSYILTTLRTGPETSSALARNLGDIPEASVRRTIQELRRMGHDIAYAGRYSGLFRLQASTTEGVPA